MWFILSLLRLMEPFCYGFAWILFTLMISFGTWIACGVRKPIATGQTPPKTPAAAVAGDSKEQPKTANEPPSDGKNEESLMKFTPSQQAVIDAELKAALNAEKKDKKDKEDKLAKEKTEGHDAKENPGAVTMVKGVDGTPPVSMNKPVSLGMTKADCLKDPNAGKLTPVTSPAKTKDENGKDSKEAKNEAKKVETAKEKKADHKNEPKHEKATTDVKHEPKHEKNEPKHEHEKPATDQKHEKVVEHKHEQKNEKNAADHKHVEPKHIENKHDAKHDKPPATLIPGKAPAVLTPVKPAAKATADQDGRSRYVGQAPNNLLVSAYVKPAAKK